MFERFQENFRRDPQGRSAHAGEITRRDVPELHKFFDMFGGASFLNGLYRIIHPADLGDWQQRIYLAFPEFEGRVACFGFDWLGSVFATDSTRSEDGQNGVVMFEPGTGEALEIPANLVSFHDSGLLDFGEAALAMSFYERWCSSGGPAPTYDQCIGYKKPLFLGGSDEVGNLERSDLDVYWYVTSQLIRKTKGLPEGGPVRARKD